MAESGHNISYLDFVELCSYINEQLFRLESERNRQNLIEFFERLSSAARFCDSVNTFVRLLFHLGSMQSALDVARDVLGWDISAIPQSLPLPNVPFSPYLPGAREMESTRLSQSGHGGGSVWRLQGTPNGNDSGPQRVPESVERILPTSLPPLPPSGGSPRGLAVTVAIKLNEMQAGETAKETEPEVAMLQAEIGALLSESAALPENGALYTIAVLPAGSADVSILVGEVPAAAVEIPAAAGEDPAAAGGNPAAGGEDYVAAGEDPEAAAVEVPAAAVEDPAEVAAAAVIPEQADLAEALPELLSVEAGGEAVPREVKDSKVTEASESESKDAKTVHTAKDPPKVEAKTKVDEAIQTDKPQRPQESQETTNRDQPKIQTQSSLPLPRGTTYDEADSELFRVISEALGALENMHQATTAQSEEGAASAAAAASRSSSIVHRSPVMHFVADSSSDLTALFAHLIVLPEHGSSGIFCRVCLDDPFQHYPTLTRCGHIFCKHCIELHVLTLSQCPACEACLTVSYLIPIFLCLNDDYGTNND